MSIEFIEYLSQFLPIAIGVGAMLVLRSVRGRRRRIKIEAAISTIDDELANGLHDGREMRGITSFLELSFSIKAKAALKTDLAELYAFDKKLNSWRGYVSPDDDIPRSLFRRIVQERRIVGGIPGNGSSGAEDSALLELGIVDLSSLDDMMPRFNRYGKERLTVFIRERRDLIDKIAGMGKSSGMLLGYLLDSNLDVIGAGNELDW